MPPVDGSWIPLEFSTVTISSLLALAITTLSALSNRLYPCGALISTRLYVPFFKPLIVTSPATIVVVAPVVPLGTT